MVEPVRSSLRARPFLALSAASRSASAHCHRSRGFHVPDNGHHESVPGLYGNADVDRFELPDLLAPIVKVRIAQWKCFYTFTRASMIKGR